MRVLFLKPICCNCSKDCPHFIIGLYDFVYMHIYMHVGLNTTFPPGYHHNGYVASSALGQGHVQLT